MTDNEIIKALEQCEKQPYCDGCPYFAKIGCKKHLYQDALDLINRQKAEIEKLQKAGEEAVSCFNRMESLYNIKNMELKVARAEAITEFEERLKEGLPKWLHPYIDTVKKEIAGEE